MVLKVSLGNLLDVNILWNIVECLRSSWVMLMYSAIVITQLQSPDLFYNISYCLTFLVFEGLKYISLMPSYVSAETL